MDSRWFSVTLAGLEAGRLHGSDWNGFDGYSSVSSQSSWASFSSAAASASASGSPDLRPFGASSGGAFPGSMNAAGWVAA